MVEKNITDEVQEQSSNAVKDPDQWVTGEEAMTGAQKSYQMRRKAPSFSYGDIRRSVRIAR